MNKLFSQLPNIFHKPQPIPKGIYQHQLETSNGQHLRLHLRLEQDGTGVLIVNAGTILHLNQIAAEFAYYLTLEMPETEIIKKVSSRYRVKPSQVKLDYSDTLEKIIAISTIDDIDPVMYLGLDRLTPFSKTVDAPYRIDCALTYKLPLNVSQSFAPHKNVKTELTTKEWITIFHKAWDAGIPHIILTGGEPTMRDDLPELISAAEEIGAVTGMITDGMRLVDHNYLLNLLNSGLDHLIITTICIDQQLLKKVNRIIESDIFTTLHLSINDKNKREITTFFQMIKLININSVSLSISQPNLQPYLTQARLLAQECGIKLIWDIPVPYSKFNPVYQELIDTEKFDGAGKGWIYIEPDGDVYPGQGISDYFGNLLNDPWENVWKKCLVYQNAQNENRSINNHQT